MLRLAERQVSRVRRRSSNRISAYIKGRRALRARTFLIDSVVWRYRNELRGSRVRDPDGDKIEVLQRHGHYA